MTPTDGTRYPVLVFVDFENDIARRPNVRAELEDLTKYTVDWADVRQFWIRHDVAFELRL